MLLKFPGCSKQCTEDRTAVQTVQASCSALSEDTSLLRKQHSADSSLDIDRNTSSSETDAGIAADVPFVQYPASLPKFSPPIADVLASGVKSQVMLVYTEIVKESMLFYMNMLPRDTGRAKLSLANIGRTMVERYPVLAVSDRQNPWTYFNEKLSQYLRNARNRIKHKLSSPSRTVKVAKLTVHNVSAPQLSEEDYEKHVSELKLEMVKKEPDVEHLKELARITYTKRRSWVDGTPSHELSMRGILDQFPCFRLPELLLQELALMHGEEKVNDFDGISTIYYMPCH